MVMWCAIMHAVSGRALPFPRRLQSRRELFCEDGNIRASEGMKKGGRRPCRLPPERCFDSRDTGTYMSGVMTSRPPM